MKKTAKQIAALIGVALLLSLYVLLFIFAIFDFEGSDIMFRACLIGTISIPLLIWIYIYLFEKLKKSRNASGNDEDITLHK